MCTANALERDPECLETRLAVQGRGHHEEVARLTTRSIVSPGDGDGAASEGLDPGFADCVFDRLRMLKLRTSALRRRLEREDETPAALLRLYVSEIERDGDAVESLLRQELGLSRPGAPDLPELAFDMDGELTGTGG